MIYNADKQEHLPYISEEEFFEKMRAKGNIMDSQFAETTRYACPTCKSTGKSPKNRKKECGMCGGKGVVFV